MADQDDQRARAREFQAPKLRQRFETLLLSVGAAAIGVVVVLMAIHRLSNDTVTKRTATTKPPVTSTAAPTTTTPAEPPRVQITAETEQAALAQLAGAGHPIYCGGTTKGMVAVTFDDGPGQYTHLVLRRLKRNKARGTFFLAGQSLAAYGDLVAQVLDHGAIGTVGQTGLRNLTQVAQADREADVTGAQRAIAKRAKQDVQLFRPPLGSRNAKVDGIAQRAGMVEVLWSVDGGAETGVDFATVKKNVIPNLKAGAIVRLQDNQGQAVKALPAILHAIKAKGLRAVSLPLMLTADPPTARQLKIGKAAC